jgi:hypothetical protein
LHEAGELEALVFKGGTALRKLYAGNQGRFSLDLDFSLAAPTDSEAVVFDLVGAIDGAAPPPLATCTTSRGWPSINGSSAAWTPTSSAASQC